MKTPTWIKHSRIVRNPLDKPFPSALQSAVYYGGHIYIFGGHNDYEIYSTLHKYNIKTKEWSRVETQSPPERSGHTAVVYGNSMFVFGGHVYVAKKTNELLEYKFEEQKWYKVEQFGKIPEPRTDHTALVYGDKMIVFGGYDVRLLENDLFEYNFEYRCWNAIESKGQKPSLRYAHSATLFHRVMYIFAGFDTFFCNDLYKYDIESRTWTLVQKECPIISPRSRHTAVTLRDKMIVFGGKGRCEHSNSCFELDYYTLKWKELKCEGIPPCGKWCHSAVLADNTMYVFGGQGKGEKNDNEMCELMFPSIESEMFLSKVYFKPALWDVSFEVAVGTSLVKRKREEVEIVSRKKIKRECVVY